MFREVSDKVSPQLMPTVASIFREILQPLYGSQEKAIKQIQESSDRKCFLLMQENEAAGILVYKTQPSNEFEEFGVIESIEIKSLFLNHPERFGGKGLGSKLLKKLFDELKNMEVAISNVHVTVSAEKAESLAFFQKKGFTIVHTWDGRYKAGVAEYLLICEFPTTEMELVGEA